MASVLFQNEHSDRLAQLHVAMCGWSKQYSDHDAVRTGSILKDPRDGTLSFLVSFPDTKEKVFKEEIGRIVTRVSAAERVTRNWFIAQGRPDCV